MTAKPPINKNFPLSHGVTAGKWRKIRDYYEQMMEAVTFAEAGELDIARQVAHRGENESSKILAVEKSEEFSGEIKSYAVQLAKRVGFELVAISICDDEGKSKKESFQIDSEKAAAAFQAEAVESGIRFCHVVKFGRLKDILGEIRQEIRRIKLVVTSSEIGTDEIEGSLKVPVFIASSTR